MGQSVSVALADEGAPLAVLLTYGAEMRSTRASSSQQIFAILLPVQGRAVEMTEPNVGCGSQPRVERSHERIWQDLFAPGYQAVNWRPSQSLML